MTSTLPEPSPEEQERSSALRTLVLTEIETAGGVMDFSRFMELALYAPGLGYYTRQRVFGETGDYVTAPEISPLFGQCLARQCAQILPEFDEAIILEAGAGTGVLAKDILIALDQLQQLPKQYLILELSPSLRLMQEQTIKQHAPDLLKRVEWIQQLPDKGFKGLIIANEVLDAMPVQIFHTNSGGVNTIAVSTDEQGRLIETEQSADEVVTSRVHALNLPDDYRSEINLRAEAWVRTIAEALEQGVMFLIDYGFHQGEYYLPERNRGTLMCHYRHHAHDDPYQLVGLQDITTHVDFSAMAHAGVDGGLEVLGYTTQAAFLLANGILDLADGHSDHRKHLELTSQIKKLTLPHEMGELFKVLALGNEIKTELDGFSLQDRSTSL